MKILKANERKAISPIIATVLIIAATLIAFAAIGGYVFGIFGSGSSTANVQVVSVAMKAADFTTAATTAATPTCGAAVNDYITMTNTGTAGTTITGASITWAGATKSYTMTGTCTVGAAGVTGVNGATTSLLWGANTNLAVAAVSGQSYSVQVTLSNGAILTYQSTWL